MQSAFAFLYYTVPYVRIVGRPASQGTFHTVCVRGPVNRALAAHMPVATCNLGGAGGRRVGRHCWESAAIVLLGRVTAVWFGTEIQQPGVGLQVTQPMVGR